MKTEATIWAILGGIFIPTFEYFYGTDEIAITMMVTLLFFLVLDWITGISAARKDKVDASKYGIDGLFRSFFILLLPAGAHMLGKLYGLPNIVMGLFVGFLLLHISKSFLANAVRCGWGEWIPVGVLNIVMKWVENEINHKVERSIKRGAKVEVENTNDTKG